MLIRSIILLSVFILVSGCSTLPVQKNQPQDFSQLYLRGVFSWWEADEKYKVVRDSSELYYADVRLIADGQPYDFKFADKNWTPGLSCGPQTKADTLLKIGNTSVADCGNPQQNFKFTPVETGVYRFYFNTKQPIAPLVYVRRLS